MMQFAVIISVTVEVFNVWPSMALTSSKGQVICYMPFFVDYMAFLILGPPSLTLVVIGVKVGSIYRI